jgi:hypothetical protein
VFIVQWTDAGTGRKQREPLGAWGAITLAQARAAAQARLGRVAQGINPAIERTQAKLEDQRQRYGRRSAEARFTLDADIPMGKTVWPAKLRRYAAGPAGIAVAFASHLPRRHLH